MPGPGSWRVRQWVLMARHTATLLSMALLLIHNPAFPESLHYGSFHNVVFHSCYDGDTCTFTLPGVHPLVGDHISVRLRGIDAPENRGQGEAEKRKAIAARDFLRRLLRNASPIG